MIAKDNTTSSSTTFTDSTPSLLVDRTADDNSRLRSMSMEEILETWQGPVENGSLTEFLPSPTAANSSHQLLSLANDLNLKRFSCLQCDHPCNETVQCHDAVKCFVSSTRGVTTDGVRYRRGCVPSVETAALLCRHPQHVSSKAVYHIDCCQDRLCNSGPYPRLPDLLPEPGSGSGVFLLWFAPLVLLLLFLLAALLLWLQRTLAASQNQSAKSVVLLAAADTRGRRRHRRRLGWLRRWLLGTGGASDAESGGRNQCRQQWRVQAGNLAEEDAAFTVGLTASDDTSTLKEMISMTSGSGSGLPLLVQRTLAKEVLFCELVGRGRYGEVWKGIWHKEPVAIKIFYSRDEASWSRETEIYNTVLLRHANILGYLGSDMMTRGSCTQLLLVTSYHAAGSLYDHLQRVTLSDTECVRLLLTAATGLSHLHTELHGSQGKPAIAHRDVKTKNVLVRADGQAVIADLGLAVVNVRGCVDMGHNVKVGTKRYMPPEVLNDSLDGSKFDAFLKGDMYAFGLLIWETARRCRASGRAEDARVPFDDIVPNDPGFDDMRKIVCVDRQRPAVPNHWMGHSMMLSLSRLMKECWHHDPQVRLSALRVKKSLANIFDGLVQEESA